MEDIHIDDEKIKRLERNMGCLCIFYLAIMLISIVRIIYDSSIADKWNRGFCPECDTQYQCTDINLFAQYYECPNCEYEIIR